MSFKLKGINAASRVHNLTKIAAGSAELVISGDYAHQEKRRFVVQVQTGGEVGQATCRWSRDGGLTWEESNLITGDREHPLDLWGGLKVHWESGSGPDLVAGDYWQFWAGEPAEHPRRLSGLPK